MNAHPRIPLANDVQMIDIKYVPPSTNSLFRNARGVGRVKTEPYKVWINAAGWDVAAAKVKPIHQPVSVTMLVRRKNKRSDLDNMAKGPLDLLVKHGVILDDSQVMSLTLQWSDAVEGVRIFLEPFRKEKAA